MRQKMSFGELPQEKGYLNEEEVMQIPLANGNACSNEQKGSSKDIRASRRLEVKTCPVCGARCFSDMDTCYNCLHSFVHDEMKSEEASPSRNGQFATMESSAERSSVLDSRPREGGKTYPICGIVKTDRSRWRTEWTELGPLSARRLLGTTQRRLS